MTKRVLVCGGRDYADRERFARAMIPYRQSSTIIHGGAMGADMLADEWARHHEIPVRIFPAAWERDGKAAGPIRNQRMLDEGRPELVVAFPGGRGTADMVRRAKAAGVEVVEVPARSTTPPQEGGQDAGPLRR